MFTKNVARRRGRPAGATEQGLASREQLFHTAIGLLATKGYDATTLRDIAAAANVSTGLLYRYFPSKRAVVLALYDELSAEYATRAARIKPGPWRERFMFALETSLAVLGPQRPALAALTPVLVGDANDGLFAPATALSRERVQSVFRDAVRGASDAPDAADADALARTLYVIHLVVTLWWLLDKSPHQRATKQMLAMLKSILPMAAMTLRLAPARAFIRGADVLFREGLFGESS
jgi:AcrR family transcriptional regulator